MANEFPNIKAMGLMVFDHCRKLPPFEYRANMELPNTIDPYFVAVSAVDLEKALSEAPKVFGRSPEQDVSEIAFSREKAECDVHEARLVCIQPIDKESVKIEFESIVGHRFMVCNGDKNLDHLQGKRVKVTIEELP